MDPIRSQPPEQPQPSTSGAPAGHSDAFIPLHEPGMTRTDFRQSPLPARRESEPDSQHDSDAEPGPTTSPSLGFLPHPKFVTPDKPDSRPNITTSSSEVTPPPLVFSRRPSAALPARPETEPGFQHDSDVEPGFTTSPLPPPKVSNRPNTANTTNTANTLTPSVEVTQMAPVLVTSRRNTDNGNRALRDATYSNLGSTVMPPTRESRRISSGPEQTLDRRSSTVMRTGTGTDIDWIVPVEKIPYREKTVAERLEPTLSNAIAEKTKYVQKARLTGYALNAAIGLQVVFGSLTTALSVVVKGSQVSVMTAVLGGLSTIVASYLARARGSNEPELSITRVKDLEQFIRECDAFKLDHGHETGDKFDKELDRFRGRFEELLGNANGERKLSTV